MDCCGKQPDSDSSYRKRLASLTTHLRKYEKPKPRGYDVYATSYIGSDVPWQKILQDDSTSHTADLPPFSPNFEIGHLAVQEKEKKLRGESIRKQDILASSHDIVQHFRDACSSSITASDRNQHLAYLYFKAMQYSEVNKAQALDERYPKPNSDVIRSTYSREHQAAIAATHGSVPHGSGKDQPSILRKDKQLVKLPNTKKILSSASTETRRMATEKEREDLMKLRMIVREALGSPMISRQMKLKEEHWQFKGKTESRQREVATKRSKAPWKRNVYPPKTREEHIAELRARAPPLDKIFWKTDYFPGLWEPELMIPTFKTAYVQAREKEKEDLIEVEDKWSKIFQTNKKCREWLNAIPATL